MVILCVTVGARADAKEVRRFAQQARGASGGSEVDVKRKMDGRAYGQRMLLCRLQEQRPLHSSPRSAATPGKEDVGGTRRMQPRSEYGTQG
jgi:hypothetical protein